MTEEKAKNVYSKLQQARVLLQKTKLTKSGKNAYSGFTYFELKDFIPTVNEIFLEIGLSSNFSIIENIANLFIVNTDNTEENVLFTSPIEKATLKGCTPIQEIGAVHTYMKRYLYLNALEIVEDDFLDKNAGSEDNKKPPVPQKKKVANKTSDKVSSFVSKLKEAKLTTEQMQMFCSQYNISSKDETTIDNFLKNNDFSKCLNEFMKAS